MGIRLHLPPHGGRLIYDLRPFGLREVPYFAAQNLPRTTPGFPRHFHRGMMEINHILKGERIYTVAGEPYLLHGNQVFITWPDEPHGCRYMLHGRGLHFWLQMRLPAVGRPFLGMGAAQAQPLLEALHHLPRRQFPAAPGLRGLFSRMLALCRAGPSALVGVELSALMVEWLLLLISRADESCRQEVTPDIAEALQMAAGQPPGHLSLEHLADVAHLSLSRFKGKFKEQMGMPPGEYLLRRRLEAATDLLLAGEHSVTAIAFDLGFASSQHFATIFRKFFGAGPLDWAAGERESLARLAGEPDGAGTKRKKKCVPWIEDGVFHGYLL